MTDKEEILDIEKSIITDIDEDLILLRQSQLSLKNQQNNKQTRKQFKNTHKIQLNYNQENCNFSTNRSFYEAEDAESIIGKIDKIYTPKRNITGNNYSLQDIDTKNLNGQSFYTTSNYNISKAIGDQLNLMPKQYLIKKFKSIIQSMQKELQEYKQLTNMFSLDKNTLLKKESKSPEQNQNFQKTVGDQLEQIDNNIQNLVIEFQNFLQEAQLDDQEVKELRKDLNDTCTPSNLKQDDFSCSLTTKSEYKVSLFNDNLFYKNSKGRSRGGAIEKGGLKRSSSMPDVLEELKGQTKSLKDIIGHQYHERILNSYNQIDFFKIQQLIMENENIRQRCKKLEIQKYQLNQSQLNNISILKVVKKEGYKSSQLSENLSTGDTEKTILGVASTLSEREYYMDDSFINQSVTTPYYAGETRNFDDVIDKLQIQQIIQYDNREDILQMDEQSLQEKVIFLQNQNANILSENEDLKQKLFVTEQKNEFLSSDIDRINKVNTSYINELVECQNQNEQLKFQLQKKINQVQKLEEQATEMEGIKIPSLNIEISKRQLQIDLQKVECEAKNVHVRSLKSQISDLKGQLEEKKKQQGKNMGEGKAGHLSSVRGILYGAQNEPHREETKKKSIMSVCSKYLQNKFNKEYGGGGAGDELDPYQQKINNYLNVYYEQMFTSICMQLSNFEASLQKFEKQIFSQPKQNAVELANLKNLYKFVEERKKEVSIYFDMIGKATFHADEQQDQDKSSFNEVVQFLIQNQLTRNTKGVLMSGQYPDQQQ